MTLFRPWSHTLRENPNNIFVRACLFDIQVQKKSSLSLILCDPCYTEISVKSYLLSCLTKGRLLLCFRLDHTKSFRATKRKPQNNICIHILIINSLTRISPFLHPWHLGKFSVFPDLLYNYDNLYNNLNITSIAFHPSRTSHDPTLTNSHQNLTKHAKLSH